MESNTERVDDRITIKRDELGITDYPNDILTDTRLSVKARGLFGLVLYQNQHVGPHITVEGLHALAPSCTTEDITTILRELEHHKILGVEE